VLFWSLDRLSCEDVSQTLGHLERLTSYGVNWRSFTEMYLDSCGLFRDAVIGILAVIAKQERIRHCERASAAIARLRRQGKTEHLGRPQLILDRVKTKRLREQGRSVRKIAKATINKEVAYLRRAFKLGASETPPLVIHVPRFEILDTSNNVREGTLEHDVYRIVRDLLNPYGRIALVLAYHTGARAGELRQIRIDRIDFKAARINLPGFTTKNGKPRYLPIFGDMRAEIEMAISKGSHGCPFLIQHEGRQVSKSGWKKNWATACTTAGVSTTLFHDLRRTALTNMIEAGFSEKEAMEISGHKTRYVFDRYHIVSDRRLREMASKLDAFLKAKSIAAEASENASKLKGVVH
jgi:integrase